MPETPTIRASRTTVPARETSTWSGRITDGIARLVGEVKPGHGRLRAAPAQSGTCGEDFPIQLRD